MNLSLRDRLAALRQQHKKSAPSFSPGPRQARAKVVEVIPDINGLVPASELDSMRELLANYMQYGRVERTAKKAKDEVSIPLKALCNDYSLTKARSVEAGAKLTYYPMHRESVNPQLLKDEGVSQEIIDRCTIKTDSYAIRVSPIDADEEDEDE